MEIRNSDGITTGGRREIYSPPWTTSARNTAALLDFNQAGPGIRRETLIGLAIGTFGYGDTGSSAILSRYRISFSGGCR